MAKKVARGIEQELEKARGDGRWEDIPKLLNDLNSTKSASSLSEPYKELVECECQVETLFSEYKLEQDLHEPLKTHLVKLKSMLEKVYEDGKEMRLATSLSDCCLSKVENGRREWRGEINYLILLQQSVLVDALFLLCKVSFMIRDYDEAMKYIELLEQDSSNFEGYRRRLKITADMFAIKGMALEELQHSSTTTMVRDDDIVECYDHAGDVFLSMLLASDSKSSLPRNQSVSGLLTRDSACIGQPLEIALQRSTILNIRLGHINRAVERLHYLLRNLEALDKSVQSVRKTLIQQLVDVLLQGVCGKSYVIHKNHPTAAFSKNSLDSSSSQSKTHLLDSSLLFIPENVTEDVILLLLLKEALVLQNATSSIVPEEASARKITMADANCTYNLLTIGLARYEQFSLLVECLERAMKLAFEEFHLWFQFGLALASARKFSMAVLVLKQCHELRPDDPMVLLHASKICFNNLHQFDEGLEMARRTIEVTKRTSFSSKAYLALGIGCCLKAATVLTNKKKQQLYLEGIQAFEKCLEHDPEDKEALFHLALTQSLLRKTIKALRNAYAALKLDCNYLFALQLIVLLLSAKKKYREALDACDTALLEYHDDFVLLLLKVKLEEVWLGGDQALVTCKRLLKTWKRLHDSDNQSIPDIKRAGSGLIDKIVSDKRSLNNLQLAELGSDKDETSSVGASVRLESTLSEEAGSLSVCQLSVPAALALQARIWLTIAEIYVHLGKESEATACVREANLVFPLSPDVLFQRGHIYETKENFNEAKRCYENAIAINPNHTTALQHLGIVFYKMKNYTMSEKVLREAINIDPTLHLSWHHLGVVLQAQEQHEAASECLMTAIDLEATCPIVPFTTIPRIM